MVGVEHLDASVDFYRELGLVPVWWPDDDSVLLATGPAEVPMIMLSRNCDETRLGPGGVFAIDDLDEFHRRHPDLDWLVAPVDGSVGRYAAFGDRTGVPIRLVDYSHEPAAAAVFARRGPSGSRMVS
ncbi:hypothetical protein GCM10009789_34920 [Kribbella sancticallisti]|uniref:VOC domain-containing protein n=2 Tax=Kribbella sancticallisti TaxID=460087 RepID=A0ABN2DIT7_9ACTN